jgi:hypothetical protein
MSPKHINKNKEVLGGYGQNEHKLLFPSGQTAAYLIRGGGRAAIPVPIFDFKTLYKDALSQKRYLSPYLQCL